jgi:hypothetical protein
MDMTFDSQTWAAAGLTGDSELGRRLFSGGSPARLDWPTLAARLAAAHAFQRHGGLAGEAGMGGGAFMLRPAACSFHEPSARVLAAFTSVSPEEPPGWDEADAKRLTGNAALGREIGKVSHTVNPTSSADRKNTSGNDGTVAGLFPSGNRGLK